MVDRPTPDDLAEAVTLVDAWLAAVEMGVADDALERIMAIRLHHWKALVSAGRRVASLEQGTAHLALIAVELLAEMGDGTAPVTFTFEKAPDGTVQLLCRRVAPCPCLAPPSPAEETLAAAALVHAIQAKHERWGGV